MEYRTHRGERLSAVGIGCYSIGGAYGAKDPEQFVHVLRRAVELGVTFFDAADIYGPLPCSAVVAVHKFPCDVEGSFDLPTRGDHYAH